MDFLENGKESRLKICPVCFHQVVLDKYGVPINGLFTSFAKGETTAIHDLCEIQFYKNLSKKRDFDKINYDQLLFFARLR